MKRAKSEQAVSPESCPLCHGGDLRVWFGSSDGKWAAWHCSGCELWFVWPPESADPEADHSGRAFFDSECYIETAREAYVANREAHLERFESIYRRALRLQPCRDDAAILSQLRAADIGCGVGTSVAAMARLGISCVGCDYSQRLIEYARELEPHLEFRHGGVEALEDCEYHVISAFNIVEHVADLHGFIEQIRRKLRPGGLLVVETPDRASLFQSVLVALRALGICAHTLSQDGGHVYLFTRQALARLLAEHGFREADFSRLMSPKKELACKTLQRKGWPAALALSSVYALSELSGRRNRMIMVAQMRPEDAACEEE